MSDTVTLILAHPLSGEQAARLGIEGASTTKDYRQGDSVTLPRENGRAVINAGYAKGVEPEDRDAVHKALGETPAKAAKSAKS